MSTATVAVLLYYFTFRLYVVGFSILVPHTLLCVEIGLSEPSLMTLLITLLQYSIIARRMITVMDYTVRMGVRFVGGDLFFEVLI